MKKWEKFSEEQLKEFVKESSSFRQLGEKCGYSLIGGSTISSMKKMCEEKHFDTTHFTNMLKKEDIKIEEIFINGYKSRETLKRNLIVLRGYACECCHLKEWNEKPIPLQVHHKDGNGLNNTLDNLQLLCPNCHAQTNNYCGKNKNKDITDEKFIAALNESNNIHQAIIKLGSTDGRLYDRAKELLKRSDVNLQPKEKKEYICCDCGKKLSQSSLRCLDCENERRRQIAKNSKPISREELKQLIRITPFTKIGEMFGVTDNAIRKWCKLYNLPFKVKDIKTYSDEEWEKI